jgi:N-acetylglucosamine malate deacetylase 2
VGASPEVCKFFWFAVIYSQGSRSLFAFRCRSFSPNPKVITAYLAPIAAITLLILSLVLGGLWFVRSRLQDDTVPVGLDFGGERVMLVFPHPDDEITCAGTLKWLDQAGKETILITLTRGEAGSTNGRVEESDPILKQQKLGELRSQELQSVGQLLGIDHLEIFDFPDSGIQTIPADRLKTAIAATIDRYQPSVLITYDDRVGLYGHPDHRLIAGYVKEIFQSQRHQADFPVRQLYQITLPKPMIATALQISESFQRNYPLLAEQGLPAPTLAINISKFGSYKRDAMLLHQTQRPTFDEMQPLFDKIPPWIYFRIFDKEYFAQVP